MTVCAEKECPMCLGTGQDDTFPYHGICDKCEGTGKVSCRPETDRLFSVPRKDDIMVFPNEDKNDEI